MRRFGFTLIEVMIACAVLAIGAALLVRERSGYEQAVRRASSAEGVARVIDQELERARSCPTRACLAALATTATITTANVEALSWARAVVRRTVRPGPAGTIDFEISASAPGLLRPRVITARLWVRR